MGRRSDHTREELYRLALDAAEHLVETEGSTSLTVRRVAAAIGYSHGTLYNLFEDVDDLVAHLNGRTLDALYEAVRDVPLDGAPETALVRLADRYIAFTRRNRRRWSLMFEHHLPEGHALPDSHDDKIQRLLALAERALAPLFPPGREAARAHSARVLWSALHGISSLEASGKLERVGTVESLSRTLVGVYVEGLRHAAAKGQPAAGADPGETIR